MKIAVLVSGGVDSSVALLRLKEEGHELKAFYLKIWLEDELKYLGECPWEEDLSFVEMICNQWNIPLEILPLQKEYWDRVVAYTLAEVKAGRTPNPDMLCNQTIKFGIFYEKIPSDFHKVATGHYARLVEENGITYLETAKDALKDQTYFLAQLSQDQLKRAVFPLGDFLKSEVRQMAIDAGLPNSHRKDSQGICFLGKIPFEEFIRHHFGDRPGELIEFETGKVLGGHLGYWYYTIGQRRGLGLRGGPWFVVSKAIAKNQVFISNHYHTVDKKRDHFRVGRVNWLSGFEPILNKDHFFKLKIRHGERFHEATAIFDSKRSAEVRLTVSDQGIAAGQFAVFYDNTICLGGGVIEKSL